MCFLAHTMGLYNSHGSRMDARRRQQAGSCLSRYWQACLHEARGIGPIVVDVSEGVEGARLRMVQPYAQALQISQTATSAMINHSTTIIKPTQTPMPGTARIGMPGPARARADMQ